VETRYILGSADALSPFTHQNIMVLFSSSCNGKNVPCEPPVPSLIEFYRDSDSTLGQFVEETIFESKMQCQVCEKSMIDHCRYDDVNLVRLHMEMARLMLL
jgi:1-phosphatidylinositol-3-phosphate 5-kinase